MRVGSFDLADDLVASLVVLKINGDVVALHHRVFARQRPRD